MAKFLLFFLCVLFLSPPTLGQTPAPTPTAELTRLSGQWQGPLKVPGGELTVLVTIVPLTNGSYYAALDVPQQRIARMPVEVALKGSSLTLRIEQAGSRFEGQVLADGRQLKGTWQQPGLSTPLLLTRSITPAAAQAARKLRLTPPYRQSNVVFVNAAANLKLAGTLTVPSGAGPFPAVVLLSDSGPHDRDAEVADFHFFGILADYLTRRGVAVLRFDDRGVGRSGGNYARATTPDFVSDAQAALAFLRAQPLIAPAQVGLLGHGEGGNVALLAAAAAPTAAQPGPAFVAALAAYGQPGREVLRRQQGEILRLIGANATQVRAGLGLYDQVVATVRQTPNTTKARVKVYTLLRSANSGFDDEMSRARAAQLTSPWTRYFLDFDPADRLPQARCPVLLLHGTADLEVAAGRQLSALQRGLRRSGQRVDTYRLAGVNHLFQGPETSWPIVNGERQATIAPAALDRLREWLLVQQARASQVPLPVTVRR